jgi:magnesium transporter
VQFMIQSVYYNPNGEKQENLSNSDMHNIISSRAGLLWVNLKNPSPEDFHSILENVFHFHPLAVEDCQNLGYQTPKVDDYDDYLFIIYQALQPGHTMEAFDTIEVNCFLGENYLVTSSLSPAAPPIETVWNRLNVDDRLRRRGPDFICHAVLDSIVDEYLPWLNAIEDEIDRLEDEVLTGPLPTQLERILNMKHTMLALRRVVSPQREIMNRLSRDDFPQIKPQQRIYYRDIYDHLVRIQDISDTIRDIVSGTLDTYLSATSNRMNEVMKVLTIISTVFLPLTFLAGVYGMNFQHMPELSQVWTYPLLWLVFIGIALGMIWYFKQKKWF